jgi:hypothetical protein
MFCNFCGAQLQADQRFCGSCGGAVAPGPPIPFSSATLSRVAGRVRLLGILWIAFSAMRLLRGGRTLFGAGVVRVVGLSGFDDVPWGWPVSHFMPVVLSLVGMLTLILAVAGFAVGWGLLERRPWARTLGIVIGVIALMSPPLGTPLGIYTLWVLVPHEAEVEWRRIARPA